VDFAFFLCLATNSGKIPIRLAVPIRKCAELPKAHPAGVDIHVLGQAHKRELRLLTELLLSHYLACLYGEMFEFRIRMDVSEGHVSQSRFHLHLAGERE